jgi:hypothetical protein
LSCLTSILFIPRVFAQDENTQIVEYRSEFFSRYRPNTALDMVRQLPGFQLTVGSVIENNRDAGRRISFYLDGSF